MAAAVRCRPGIITICGGPGSAVHRSRIHLATGWLFALALRRIRDTHHLFARRRMSSAAGGERLDAPGVADERDHDGDAAGEEDSLRDVYAVRPQIQVAGDRPAAGKGGAEDL